MFSRIHNKYAMTFIEVLIVTALVSVVSLALYHGFSNGLKVWKRSQQVVVEENIIIFFEKITKDLQNAYKFSTITFQGNRSKFSFPVILPVKISSTLSNKESVYAQQLARVEYYYDYNKETIFRREGNYGQALKDQYFEPRKVVEGVDGLMFKYYYMTDNDEIYSEDILETIPSKIAVTIEFIDNGYRRAMTKYIPVPIGS